jgi:tRNA(fMet)-specific endonuclease VapC
MALLVDTSVLIALERRQQPLSALEAVVSSEPMAIAAITASELLLGVLRAEPSDRRDHRARQVEAFLSGLPVVPFDLPIARVHARLSALLMTAGRQIGANDLLIAATALSHGYRVLSQDMRHFGRVPGLVVRQPDW